MFVCHSQPSAILRTRDWISRPGVHGHRDWRSAQRTRARGAEAPRRAASAPRSDRRSRSEHHAERGPATRSGRVLPFTPPRHPRACCAPTMRDVVRAPRRRTSRATPADKPCKCGLDPAAAAPALRRARQRRCTIRMPLSPTPRRRTAAGSGTAVTLERPVRVPASATYVSECRTAPRGPSCHLCRGHAAAT